MTEKQQPEKPTLPEDSEWADETIAWFNAWRNSPRTDGWDACQWQYMFDTALVHSLIYGANEFSFLGELRGRLNYLGLTFEPTKTTTKKEAKITTLDVIKGKRSERVARAENKARA